MVQAFLGRVLPDSRNHRPAFYMDAAPTAAHCDGIDDLFANRNRSHGQLLLLQSADDRVVFIIN